jgi:hypothetical protein
VAESAFLLADVVDAQRDRGQRIAAARFDSQRRNDEGPAGERGLRFKPDVVG